MNPTMTTHAQNSQIFNLIHFMRTNNMMHLQRLVFRFTNKAIMRIKKKCSFAIIARSFPIILIVNTTPFKRMKGFLFAFVGAKLSPRSSRYRRNSTLITVKKFLRRRLLTSLLPTYSRTECSSFVFGSRNIRRPEGEFFSAFLTRKFHQLIARGIITRTRAELSSILFKRVLACGTSFHMSIITLAMANVNYKTPEPMEV